VIEDTLRTAQQEQTDMTRSFAEAHLVTLHKAGQHTSAELAELFGVARSTVYRAIERAAAVPLGPAR
jgi:DNA-binding MurR/RpiR family transcriptional regulator